MSASLWILAWGLAASCAAFVLFGLDKTFARRGSRRIPEKRLLFAALLGGAAGAKLAQRFFRHKTHKQPFASRLNMALAVNLVAALGLLVVSLDALPI